MPRPECVYRRPYPVRYADSLPCCPWTQVATAWHCAPAWANHRRGSYGFIV